MSNPIKVWRCRKWVHAQPCYHGRCACGYASAFDHSADECRDLILRGHTCEATEAILAQQVLPL